MSIDSTAQLLFNIGANTDDAEANVSRFRTLLGTDLNEMGSQFADWSKELVGEIGTVQAAMTAGAAVIGAAMVGIGAASIEAANKYAEYVGEVARGSKTTGIAATDMSALKFAASETGTSYDSLVTGLTRFGSTIAKANEGGDAQQKMFARLGISQEQVKAGEKDLLPLLMATADSFQHMGSQVKRSAAARDLFSRGGPELVKLLSMGSDGLKKFADEAKAMGLIVGQDDVDAMNKYKAVLKAIEAEHESLDIEIGRKTLPLLEAAKLGWLGMWKAVLAGKIGGIQEFMASVAANTGEAAARAEELAQALAKAAKGGDGSGIDDLDKKVKEAASDFSGLSSMVEMVDQRMNAGAVGMAKVTGEMSHLHFEIAKATREYHNLASAGKLTAESAKREAAALAQLPRELAQLLAQLSQEAATKSAEAYQQFADDISRRTAEQGAKTYAGDLALWDQEIQGLQDHLAKEKDISAEGKAQLSAALDHLQDAGEKKRWQDHTETMIQAHNDLDRRMEALSEKSYAQQVADWNREMNGLVAQYAGKAEDEEDYDAQVETLRKAGLDKIDHDQQAAYTREMTRLQERLGGMLNAEATRVTKLAEQYQKDLLAFSDAEQAKVLLTTNDETKIAAIHAEFAALRTALLGKYGADLQALANSQGWQAVFGSKFADGLKNNEALMKQWATSSNQSAMLVQVSMENLKEMSQQAFDQMAQGMGAGIANALVYSKSIGAAMEAVLKSTLESLAARAFTEAIFSTAWGFMDLAEGNAAGASAAFTAAAIFGAVGAAAGVAGIAVPGGSGATGTSAGASAGSGSSGSGQGAATGVTAAPAAGPHVTVNVQGHVFGVSGVQELASAINDAVLNRDVTLTATNTKTSQVVTR